MTFLISMMIFLLYQSNYNKNLEFDSFYLLKMSFPTVFYFPQNNLPCSPGLLKILVSKLHSSAFIPYSFPYFLYCCATICAIAAFSPHAYAPAGIIYFSIMALLYQVPNFIGPVRKVFIQPVMK